MRSIEGEGATIDEAIARALAALGVTRDQVEIEIVENATRGLLGLGRRKARVRATVRAPLGVLLDGVAVRDPEELRECPPANARWPATQQTNDHPSPKHERFDAAAVLAEILRGMRLEVSVAGDGGDGLVVAGTDSAAAIGRRGEVLDALEYLLNRIVERAGHPERLVVDCAGYRARRKATLEELAHRLAERARRRGKPVTVNPLSPADRRTVYAALASESGVAARSVGQGFYRKLMIIPGGERRGGGTAVR